MIREDRELLVEMARLNRAMVPLAMRMMDGSASTDELRDYARRLINAGEWLQRRADGTSGAIVEGEELAGEPHTILAQVSELYSES